MKKENGKTPTIKHPNKDSKLIAKLCLILKSLDICRLTPIKQVKSVDIKHATSPI